MSSTPTVRLVPTSDSRNDEVLPFEDRPVMGRRRTTQVTGNGRPSAESNPSTNGTSAASTSTNKFTFPVPASTPTRPSLLSRGRSYSVGLKGEPDEEIKEAFGFKAPVERHPGFTLPITDDEDEDQGVSGQGYQVSAGGSSNASTKA